MKNLELVFRKVDGTGRRTIVIPEPVDNIDTLTADIESKMSTYIEPVLTSPSTFDEVRVVNKTVDKIIDKI